MLLAALSGAIMQHVAPPPRRYDYEPTNMVVEEMTPAKAQRWCGHSKRVACAMPLEKGCLGVMPARRFLTGDAYERLIRHERGHCNGWRHF